MLTDAAAAQLYRELTPAMAARDHGRVVAIIGRLAGARVALGDRWGMLAQILSHRGEIALMRTVLALHIEQTGGASAARFSAAVLLADAGDPAAAATMIGTIPAGEIDPAQRAHFLATATAQAGRLDEARTWYDQALELAPASGATWHGLSVIHQFSEGDPLLGRLRSLARPAAGPTEDRAMLLYALGKAEDDVGNVDAAFAAIDAAARLIRPSRPHDAASDRAVVDRIIATPVSPRGVTPPAGDSPIFVLGAPRSGTTLVEQILSAHSGVAGGGEANVLGLVLPDEADAVVRSPSEMRADVIRLLGERFPGSGRHIDKSLGNSRLVGDIITLFPDAPLVWVQRNPIDVAWSCHRTYFAKGLGWTFDQHDIAEYLMLERRLMEHWRSVLGKQLLAVDYESLVEHPATYIPMILNHCGLGLETAALSPHTVQRTVTTASAAQVRKPISASRVSAGAAYRRWLTPFTSAFQYGDRK